MKTAKEVVKEINSARGYGDEKGLRNTAALLEILQAWPVCPVIHIAGTNGKGSVCAMLSSVLTAAGYKTGLYTSPFLQDYRERIRITGELVSKKTLARYGSETLDAAEKLRTGKGYRNTPFGLGTALALRIFKEKKTDLIILETGLGGRLDPTNVVLKPAVCVITAIGMDHMQLLGETLPEIAREKAGIIKPGVPVICYPPETTEVRRVFTDIAVERGAALIIPDRKQARIREANAHYSTVDFETESRTWPGLRISLPGAHQAMNALTALTALEELEK